MPNVTFAPATTATTVTVGDATTQLCVIQSIEGQFHSYGVTTVGPANAETETTDASDAADAFAGSPVATGVSLYVASSGGWSFTAQGDVTATAACVQWSAFAGAGTETLSQYENAGSSVDGSSADTSLEGLEGCFLSDLQGDFADDGNGAAIDGSVLTVSNASGDPTWAAAICFGGGAPIAQQDFTVDARSTPAAAHLPSSEQALCGLAAVAAMNAYDSSLTVSGDIALGNHALATVRCFYYGAKAAP